jgi:hypothetical protein
MKDFSTTQRVSNHMQNIGKALLGCIALVTIAAVEPLTAEINTTDAERFAVIFKKTNGRPNAADLQKHYLDNAGAGVRKFTPYRIENADNLAKAIAADTDRYAYAIKTCLPLVKGLTGEMQAIYLAYKGLLPERALPPVYVVFGAGNSGGTAQPDAQILGIEVHCGVGTTPEQFTTVMREMFAHETVHSWQSTPSTKAMEDPLLLYVLREGVPDYLASIVTGRRQKVELANWANANREMLFAAFERDRAIVKAGTKPDGSMSDEASQAIGRWLYNYGREPKGWKADVGYWLGSEIARNYAARSPNKKAAIEELIDLKDPIALLQLSRSKP